MEGGQRNDYIKDFATIMCEKMGGWLGGEVINKSEGLEKDALLDSKLR